MRLHDIEVERLQVIDPVKLREPVVVREKLPWESVTELVTELMFSDAVTDMDTAGLDVLSEAETSAVREPVTDRMVRLGVALLVRVEELEFVTVSRAVGVTSDESVGRGEYVTERCCDSVVEGADELLVDNENGMDNDNPDWVPDAEREFDWCCVADFDCVGDGVTEGGRERD